METKIRKNLITLYQSGKAFIIFGIWDVAKFLMIYMMSTPENRRLLEMEFFEDSLEEGMINWFLLFLVFVCAVYLGLRILIGFGAINEARGNRKKKLYIVLTVFYFISSFMSLGAIDDEQGSIDSVEVISYLIELTSLFAGVLMVVSALRLKKLYKLEQQASV